MKILLVHNAYQNPGGEDAVFAAEAQLLSAHGHTVLEYKRDNHELLGKKLSIVGAGMASIWAPDSYRSIEQILACEDVDVVHFHNTFPLISPAAYYACHKAGVPVVQTLHNYRLLCPGGTFFRDGQVCELCLGRFTTWPGVLHACYRDSRVQTAAVAAMLLAHRQAGTWEKKVDMYIAVSQFERNRFLQAGFPANQVAVKPNFVDLESCAQTKDREYAVFIGRLSPEKGIRTLVKAWCKLRQHVPLRILGDGPLKNEIEDLISREGIPNVAILGHLSNRETLQVLKEARLLVFPSEWYECFPRTIVEALGCGVPVIVSRLGSMAEIIEDGETGIHFRAGDANDLAEKVEWAWRNPSRIEEMGQAARREYESKYTPEKNYDLLMDIYQRVQPPLQERIVSS